MESDQKVPLLIHSSEFTDLQNQLADLRNSHARAASRRRRLFRRLLILLCGGLFLRWFFMGRGREHWDRHHHWQTLDVDLDKILQDQPSQTGLHVGHCATWPSEAFFRPLGDEHKYSIDNTFKFPLNPSTFTFLAQYESKRAVVIPGSLTIEQSADGDDDTVTVNVVTRFSDYALLRHVDLCEISKDEGGVGVGFFHKEHVHFDVTVRLPASSSPLLIESLETELPLFSLSLGDLANVHFKSLSLKNALLPINVQSVFAEKGMVTSSVGAIQGHFTTSSSLSLVTSLAPINVSIELVGDSKGGDARDGPTKEYTILASTALGKVNVNFTDSPVDSRLLLKANSTLSSVDVQLHSAYEGRFFLETSLSRPDVVVREVEDPSGQGRKRAIGVRAVKGNKIDGEVSWSEAGKERGEVQISSAWAPVTLFL
ncbi:hypothetical protein K443DRAFT_130445 [Laccaria amethystina LaAM-08-1]|uniref:Uncharacterized protein n=1 Tax=Laccaria amethystina LaAM-08-1 TaxID=1095629 RepID=A0A0C9Y5J0_9AGAR|nr:hypothetical protein K443DRAFT_130445 [Laccaria amethystina LaAM-08-1]